MHFLSMQRKDKGWFKGKATQSTEIKKLIFNLKLLVYAPYVEQIAKELRKLLHAQPIRFAYPLSFCLIAEQVQNLPEETKGNHMLIPYFAFVQSQERHL
jgi:hypothetical protein